MSETRHDKFVRLVQARVPKAMEAIRLVRQLSSANYEWDKVEATEVRDALQGSIDELSEAFGLATTPAAPVSQPAALESMFDTATGGIMEEEEPSELDEVIGEIEEVS